MKRSSPYRDHLDPEYRRWGEKYPRFPGVAECVRLIRSHKAQGAWADIIVHELAANAANCFPELIAAYRADSNDDVRMYVMMALEIARLPEAVPFFAEVICDGDDRFTPYAKRALKGIDTREARTALWNAEHAEEVAAPDATAGAADSQLGGA
jgi:hypothetical protein